MWEICYTYIWVQIPLSSFIFFMNILNAITEDPTKSHMKRYIIITHDLDDFNKTPEIKRLIS